MTAAHIHLMLNHVPIILMPVAAVMLSYALLKKSPDLTNGALALIIVSMLFGAGAFLTGEPAEEAVEHIAGVETDAIEPHEELALMATAATALAGLLAFAVLLRGAAIGGLAWTFATLVAAAAAAVLLAWTAFLGGRINHPELRDDSARPAANDFSR